MASKVHHVGIADDYHTKERDNLYSNWPFATAREFIQNSGDAETSELAITIDNLDATHTRIEIADKGCGLSYETLENVFLELGGTTKTGGKNIGGFGIAKTLLCFSAHKYTIRAFDYLFVGYGGVGRSVTGKENVKGTTFVTIVDRQRWGYDIGWVDVFREYLSLCQLPYRVTLNGERFTDWCYRRREAKSLSFGRIFTNKQGAHKGYVLIRVKGACAFKKSVKGLETQVVLEINEDISREVLNNNRESLKDAQEEELAELLRDLNLLGEKATEEPRNVVSVVRGTGSFLHFRRHAEVTLTNADPFESGIDVDHSSYPESAGVTAVVYSNTSGTFENPSHAAEFRESSPELPSLLPYGGGVPVSECSDVQFVAPANLAFDAPASGAPTSLSTLDRVLDTRTVEAWKRRNKLFDTVINDDTAGIDDEKTRHRIRKAIRDFNPDNWKISYRKTLSNERNPNGRYLVGEKRAKCLLLWKTICHLVISEYAELADTNEVINFAVGWYFGDAAGQYLRHNETACLLLNPVNDGGKIKYGLASRSDWHRLLALAISQVAHLAYGYTGDRYSNFVTNLTGRCLNRLPDLVRLCKKIKAVKLT